MSLAPNRKRGADGDRGTHRHPPAPVGSFYSAAAMVGAIELSTYGPTAAAGGSRLLLSPRVSESPRTLGVSEEIWTKAVHDVKIRKMSTLDAAKFYGFHHSSLHHNARNSRSSSESRTLFSPDDEAEVLEILREERLHEVPITTDNIRFVVRAIAGHGGQRLLPLEFPTSRWIHEFKFARGLIQRDSNAQLHGTETT